MSSSPNHGPAGVAYGIDVVALIKGAVAGFAVLVIGGLVTQLLAALVPGMVVAAWAVLVTLGAFVLAGSLIGDATRPPLHGAVAALAGYLLVLPLIALLGAPLAWWQVPVTAIVAAAVGAVAGFVSGRRRGPVF